MQCPPTPGPGLRMGQKATIRYQPLQAGDVPDTFADVSALVEAVGYKPSTPVREGVRKFVEWVPVLLSRMSCERFLSPALIWVRPPV